MTVPPRILYHPYINISGMYERIEWRAENGMRAWTIHFKKSSADWDDCTQKVNSLIQQHYPNFVVTCDRANAQVHFVQKGGEPHLDLFGLVTM
ncbi:MAG: hypothetical protein S4CHLAM81_01320 [Chlamydiales bacterium]|nr:hypothetical protein [Chlamydiales bacterium]MCH9634928.1 hypothetical protein [Chlamydiales bacterium]